MKTVLTKEIDGYTIVTGFDVPCIDPEATKKEIVKHLDKEGLLYNYKKATIEHGQIQAEQNAILQNEIGAAKAEKRLCRESIFIEAQKKIVEAKEKVDETRQALIVAKRKVRSANVVYFEPKAGEQAISDELYVELTEKMKVLKKNEYQLMGGSFVRDNRKTEYWLKSGNKWEQKRIEKLGEEVPKEGILPADLTAENRSEIAKQKQTERIALLTDEQKNAEKQRMLEAAISQAAHHKSILELKGEADPLAGAKQLLGRLTNEIEGLYK